jgi:hypothetical protein
MMAIRSGFRKGAGGLKPPDLDPDDPPPHNAVMSVASVYSLFSSAFFTGLLTGGRAARL